MSVSDLILEKRDGYGILTLNQPAKFNAVTADMLCEGFKEAFEKIQMDDDIRCVIITGEGRAFCSGFDVSGFDILQNPATRHEYLKVYSDFALWVRNLHKPLIAAINGMTAGMGLSIALLCDIRLASESSRFTAVRVIRGLLPDCGATYFLPRIIGLPKTLELMLSGKIIDAREAEKIGLVNRIVPAEKLMDEAKELAGEMAKGPPLALGLIRQATYAGMVNDLEQQLLCETTAQRRLFETQDCAEATAAFLKKRQPLFKGK